MAAEGRGGPSNPDCRLPFRETLKRIHEYELATMTIQNAAANGADAEQASVHVVDLNHYFGTGENRKQALFDINLTLVPGEIVIMTGPSGSGKTTFLSLAGALRSVQEGTMHILGEDLRTLSAVELIRVRRNIGFIFQFHNLFDSLSALENVNMALELHPYTDRQRREMSETMLSMLGLKDRIHYKPANLSGGQKQRVAIARALVNKPRLILADEPTAALDKEAGRTVVDLIKKHAQEDGGTIILVTHDNRILDIADRIVNMVDGRIVSSVRVQESVMIGEFLQKCPVFASQTPAELSEIAQKMSREQTAAGSVVFRQGDPGDKFYLIHKGKVEVIVADTTGEHIVETLEPGNTFGEAALLHDQPRNATIRVKEDAEFYTLKKEGFLAALQTSITFRDTLLQLFSTRRARD